MLEGLTSDPEQRQGISVVGVKRSAPPAGTSTCAGSGHEEHNRGSANAASVPQELRSDGRGFFSSVCRRRRLVASHHNPFAPLLIQSSTSLHALAEGK